MTMCRFNQVSPSFNVTSSVRYVDVKAEPIETRGVILNLILCLYIFPLSDLSLSFTLLSRISRRGSSKVMERVNVIIHSRIKTNDIRNLHMTEIPFSHVLIPPLQCDNAAVWLILLNY